MRPQKKLILKASLNYEISASNELKMLREMVITELGLRDNVLHDSQT
jgi:hypothetical protein